MQLRFEGEVTLGDPCRVSYEAQNGAVKIGGVDVLAEIEKVEWDGPVTVAVADERFSGPLAARIGWGYSEWTPMDHDTLEIGEHNILELIERYGGETIRLVVADEPFNLSPGVRTVTQTQTEDPWTIRSVQDGWQLYYDGQPWPMEPRSTDQSAAAYLERVKKRYRGDSARLLLNSDQPKTERTRGGPWRYSYPNGDGTETGVIHTSRKRDAKKVLRAQLDTQRLPNGIEWALEA